MRYSGPEFQDEVPIHNMASIIDLASLVYIVLVVPRNRSHTMNMHLFYDNQLEMQCIANYFCEWVGVLIFLLFFPFHDKDTSEDDVPYVTLSTI